MDNYLLWHLLAGTRGGTNRIKIIKTIQQKPSNAHQLKIILKMDYKTIQHHLKVLTKNRLIYSPQQNKYGGMYFLTHELESNISTFNEIWVKLNKQEKIPQPKKLWR